MAFFESRFRSETKEITLLNAKEEFLATRHGISDATLDQDYSYSYWLSSGRKRDGESFKDILCFETGVLLLPPSRRQTPSNLGQRTRLAPTPKTRTRT